MARSPSELSASEFSAPSHDNVWVLSTIADELEAEGLDVHELRDLTEELSVIEKPPGLFRRVTKRARNLAVIVLTRGLEAPEVLCKTAEKYGVPLMRTNLMSSVFISRVTRRLEDLLFVANV